MVGDGDKSGSWGYNIFKFKYRQSRRDDAGLISLFLDYCNAQCIQDDDLMLILFFVIWMIPIPLNMRIPVYYSVTRMNLRKQTSGSLTLEKITYCKEVDHITNENQVLLLFYGCINQENSAIYIPFTIIRVGQVVGIEQKIIMMDSVSEYRNASGKYLSTRSLSI